MNSETILSLLPEKLRLTCTVLEDEQYVELDSDPLDPSLSLKIRNHSPIGFNWGYGGSGPAQLALAILLEYLPVKYAESLYQPFKWAFISRLPNNHNVDETINLRKIIQEIIQSLEP